MGGRLTYSLPAFRRRLQAATQDIVVFVEGKTDRFFYSQLCCTLFNKRSYQLFSSHEIPGNETGKNALLKLHAFLEKRSSLSEEFKGKKHVILFFLDKDADDYLGRCVKSAHAIYTAYYNFETHLFAAANLARAGAAAAGIDEGSLLAVIGSDNTKWRARLSESVCEWITACLFIQKYKLPMPNFRLASL